MNVRWMITTNTTVRGEIGMVHDNQWAAIRKEYERWRMDELDRRVHDLRRRVKLSYKLILDAMNHPDRKAHKF